MIAPPGISQSNIWSERGKEFRWKWVGGELDMNEGEVEVGAVENKNRFG